MELLNFILLPAQFTYRKMPHTMKHCISWLLFLSISLYTIISDAQEPQKTLSTGKVNIIDADTAIIWQVTRLADRLRFKVPDSSLSLYQIALNKSRVTNYADGMASSLIGIATLFIDRGDLSQSLDILKIAKPYCESSLYKNGYYLINLNIDFAAVYLQKNVMDTAANYYFEALKQFEIKKSTDTSLLLSIYSNLGAMWVDDGQYELAYYYLKKANELGIATKNDKKLVEIYTNLCAVYIGKQLYDTAIYYGKQALAFNQDVGNSYMGAFASFEIGNSYYYKNQPATAIRYYEEALKPGTNIPAYLELNANMSMGEAYYRLKKYDNAEQYYFNVLNISQSTNYSSILIETYNDLDSLYSDTRNYKYALKYKELASMLKDSTLNAEKIHATTQMEVKYRTSEKDRELAQNQLQLTQQRSRLQQKNILLESLLGGVLLLSALGFTIYRGEKRKRRLQLIMMADLMKEQEIDQLKAKLNGEEEERIRIAQELHDGIMVQFSSVKMNLSCVVDRAIDPEEKTAINKIVTQLDNATRELRKSAHNLMPDMLLEEGLSEAVYYFLSELKQGLGIEIDYQHYGELPMMSTEYELMLYRIVQELAQNAIKHSKATQIIVQLNCTENILSLTVEDNGIGFKPGPPQAGGIGIKNIQSRVASLKGTMEINSEQGVGSTIYIELDIHNLQKKL